MLFSCAKVEKDYTAKDIRKLKPNADNAIIITQLDPENKQKKINIALIAPMTGDYKSIGNDIFRSVMIATYQAKSDNIRVLIFDSNKISMKEISALIKESNIYAIIGPLFYEDAISLLKNFNRKLNIPIFSLSNNRKLIDKGVYVCGSGQNSTNQAIVSFLKEKNRQNIANIFEKSDKGYQIEKDFRQTIESNKMNYITSQFYDINSNSDEYKRIAENILKRYKKTIVLDKNGNIVKFDIKKRKEFQENQKNKIYSYEHKFIDTIIASSDQHHLNRIIIGLNETSLAEKDIIIINLESMLGWVVDEDLSKIYNNNVYFVDTARIEQSLFNKDFNKFFKKNPSKLDATVYDVSSLLIYLSSTEQLTKSNIENQDGFFGTLGYFKFENNGLLKRKMNIYRSKNNTIELVDLIDYN